MLDRLSALDASFLYLEGPGAAMHVGTVMVLDPPVDGLALDRLAGLVASRIGGATRYRQRVREVAGRVASPVWVDDTAFDLGYHVRRAALPRPGTREQLAEFTARVQGRPLDRRHPLWEVYLVEGLEDDRVAVVTKSHAALVDAVHAVDIGHLLLDESPEVPESVPPPWTPRPEPSDVQLVTEAAFGLIQGTGRVRAAIGGLGGLGATGHRVVAQVWDFVAALARTASLAPASPLNVEVGPARRMCLLRHDLEDYRLVRERTVTADASVDVTLNDVMLATLAGGLRSWLHNRGDPVRTGSVVRALVPLSAVSAGAGTAGEIVAAVCDLPVGEPSPAMRLERIAFQMRRQASSSGSGGAVRASALAGLAGFAPPTLHHLGVRLGGAMSRRLFNLIVTNVPGPQHPLYAAGARMRASYPVIPLAPGQALSVGLTSYDGSVFIGLHGDREAMWDLELLAEFVDVSLREMIEWDGT